MGAVHLGVGRVRGELLGGLDQLELEGVDLALQLVRLRRAALYERPRALLDELGHLELDADRVICKSRIVHDRFLPMTPADHPRSVVGSSTMDG